MLRTCIEPRTRINLKDCRNRARPTPLSYGCSYLPYDDERITWYASVTLAALDEATGDLTEIGTFSYDGVLPEAVQFDNSSNYLAVANYDHFDDRREGSSIDFWRIQTDPLDPGNTQLIKTEFSVPVARGAHSMAIAR